MKNLIDGKKLTDFICNISSIIEDFDNNKYIQGVIDYMRYQQKDIVKNKIDTLLLLKDKMTKQILEDPNSENAINDEILVELQNSFKKVYNELIEML